MKNENKFGVNIWWTVPEVVTDGAAAQAVMAKGGFDPKLYLPLPSRRAEVSRAVYSFQDRRHKENRRVTEKAADSGTHVVYGILDRAQEGEQVSFEQGTTVRLDKATDAVTAEGKLAPDVLKAVDAYAGKVTDEDVRSFLRRVIRTCYGVAKRPSGGIYFVPAKYADKIEKAQAALGEIGTGARIYVERIQNGKEERENVWEAVENQIAEGIDEALAAVKRIEKRAEAVQSQRAKLDELGEMAKLYQRLLGEEAKYEGVAELIEQAVKVVSEKMEVIQKGTAASVAVPAMAADSKAAVKVPDAAVAVLAQAGRPMVAREIFDEAVKQGLYVSDAKDPFTSFCSVLSKAVAKGEKRVEKTGPGTWKLAA